MNAQDFAARLTGREYGNEITKAEEVEAKAVGLVVVYGYSDDNVEFRGAIHDEVGAWDGTTVALTRSGLMHKWPDDEPITKAKAKLYFAQEAQGVATIKAVWCPPNTDQSWGFETSIPHATFDVMEDGEVFCRGLVFALSNVAATVTPEAP